ncbi:MAG: 50S ribosomal protein L32 [Victivallaceae bacterium]|nr:50S ribosomal protein L32 [Victivallaceae bacterium]
MAVPKRKMSRMKKRQRKAANRYEGVQANFCTNCSAPVAPHRVCPSCGQYGGKQVISKEA